MSVLAVELLLETAPGITPERFLGAVRKVSPGAGLLGDARHDGFISLVNVGPDPAPGGRRLPPQLVFLPGTAPPDRGKLEAALGQAWGFPTARAAVARAGHCALLTDLMAATLPRGERLASFRRGLDALLTLLDPVALHWHSSDRLLDLPGYRAAGPLAGATNVRMFDVAAPGVEPGELVMDTRGLDLFGLPDLQCRFRDLPPGSVAGLLYRVAEYLFEKGDVIRDGHSIPGPEPGLKWRCRHQPALIGPPRPVLDLCPHPPHAGNGR